MNRLPPDFDAPEDVDAPADPLRMARHGADGMLRLLAITARALRAALRDERCPARRCRLEASLAQAGLAAVELAGLCETAVSTSGARLRLATLGGAP